MRMFLSQFDIFTRRFMRAILIQNIQFFDRTFCLSSRTKNIRCNLDQTKIALLKNSQFL